MLNRYGINWKKDTCEERILKILQKYNGKEINVWKLIRHSKVAQYGCSISKLRDRGYKIENRTETKDNICNSYYKLVK